MSANKDIFKMIDVSLKLKRKSFSLEHSRTTLSKEIELNYSSRVAEL
jgi:hypothetical protein